MLTTFQEVDMSGLIKMRKDGSWKLVTFPVGNLFCNQLWVVSQLGLCRRWEHWGTWWRLPDWDASSSPKIVQGYWKSPCLMGKSTINGHFQWQFSITTRYSILAAWNSGDALDSRTYTTYHHLIFCHPHGDISSSWKKSLVAARDWHVQLPPAPNSVKSETSPLSWIIFLDLPIAARGSLRFSNRLAGDSADALPFPPGIQGYLPSVSRR